MFGFPGPDTSQGERVLLALTFAAVPETGVLDADLLYRLRLFSHPRAAVLHDEHRDLDSLRQYIDGVRGTYFGAEGAMEIRVTIEDRGQAMIAFHDFPGGSFSVTVPVGEVTAIPTPGGQAIDAFIGGRDDAFFNDLPGFFRSMTAPSSTTCRPPGRICASCRSRRHCSNSRATTCSTTIPRPGPRVGRQARLAVGPVHLDWK